ncbi:MAG: TonB-dependent receptor [Caulobacterales bacterium]|nr:TonB-dependent receptor [Caulobacterales bacterium]
MLIALLLAQAAVAAASAPAAAAAPQGVTSYPASFFADQHPNTAVDMLSRVPGFTLDSGSSVRGFEGAAGNVIIDGRRPVTKSDDLEEILKRLPASAIERIDVIRGGAPGIDMQGKSVLANIIRKKGNTFRGLLHVSHNYVENGREAVAVRADASGGIGERKWELGSVFAKGIDDGFGPGPGTVVYPDGRPLERSQINTEGDSLQGSVTGAVESPLLGGSLRVNGRYYRDKYKYNENDYVYTPRVAHDGSIETDRSHEYELGATFNRDFGSKLNLEVLGLRHPRTFTIDATNGQYTTPDRFQLDRHTVETIGRGVLKYRPSEQLSLEGGAETAVNTLNSHTAEAVDGLPVTLPAANVRVREDRAEAFGKAVWSPTPAWTVDAGFRYERSAVSSKGDVVLDKTLRFAKPRLTVIWAGLPKTQIRGRIEREVGQLNFDDFVASTNLGTGSGVTAGNPNLNPEQAWVGELTLEQRFWKDGLISVAFRHYRITDAIDRGPVTTATGVIDAPENIGKGTKDELALNLTVPLDRLGIRHGLLKGDVTKRWSSVTDPTTRESREISALHPLDWNAYFSQDLPQWNALWGIDVYGAWRKSYYRFNLVEDQKLKTYVRPYAEWRPRPDINIRIELPNVTARGLRTTDRLYAGPRNTAGPPIVSDRDLNFPNMYYIRVRKTFGG